MKRDKAARAAIDTDWARVAAMSDEEIERNAASDTENPATTAADWQDAIIGMPPSKTYVRAALDGDIVDWFKAQGRDYQSRMNAVLRRYVDARRKVG